MISSDHLSYSDIDGEACARMASWRNALRYQIMHPNQDFALGIGEDHCISLHPSADNHNSSVVLLWFPTQASPSHLLRDSRFKYKVHVARDLACFSSCFRGFVAFFGYIFLSFAVVSRRLVPRGLYQLFGPTWFLMSLVSFFFDLRN